MPDVGLSRRQRALKRSLDLIVSIPGLIIASPVILAAVLIATVDTRAWGIFSQTRIGKDGVPFRVHKVRTMRVIDSVSTTVTSSADRRVTRTGRVLRRFKLDELPQLYDVVRGRMSLVGPRPDVPGFADLLEGDDRVVLSVRPGITGPATLAYRNEEELLASVDDPERYNRSVIWPDKVRINRDYISGWSLLGDLRYIARTVRG